MTPEALPERLASKIRIAASGCWQWTACKNQGGYGRVQWEGQIVYAHRLVRHLLVGDVETRTTDRKTDQLDHLCRNRACVNPLHVEPVTARENVLRSDITTAAVNARKTHCPQGHPYDKTNTYLRPEGGRECRTCAAVQHRAMKSAVPSRPPLPERWPGGLVRYN